jgi:L-ascorbate metabolism protein UlaG (beta-lactamase superfamily)
MEAHYVEQRLKCQLKKFTHKTVPQISKQSSFKNRRGRMWRFLRQIGADYTRPVKPAPHAPDPASWKNDTLIASWLGHSTVLLNLHGVNILTDPVFSVRAGLKLGFLTIGPKRYMEPALDIKALPPIHLILLTHAHMDHFDLPSLRQMNKEAVVVTAKSTADLLHKIAFKQIIELDWNESRDIDTAAGSVNISAFEVRHWGARMRSDDHRSYNGYIATRNGLRVCVAGDTAFTPLFGRLKSDTPIDLMLAPIGAYQPWITSHCTPEQAVEMADMAGAKFIMPIHHQTFKLSLEPMDEPLGRFQKALSIAPERIALTEIGQTFVLPSSRAE